MIRPHHAVVVGGGIGGLAAALALARRDLRVTVLEQAPALREVGAGLQIGPNASRILHSLGLADALAAIAFRPEAIEMRDWRTGRRIFDSPLGESALQRYGAPYLHVHRADLHAVLSEAVGRDARIELHLNARCGNVAQDADSATALLDDGRRHGGDILIGADGIKSAVRTALFGAESPRFTGCVAWRGIVPTPALRGVEVRPVAANWMGPGAHFVHYFVRGGRELNFVAVIERGEWGVESWTERGDKRELVERFAGWNPTVRAIIAASDPGSCFKWALYDRDPLPRWGRGRVSLLGDACHPMLPFMAQGACMAIEDAAVLGQCLGGATPVESGLDRYENLRRARTAMVQLASRRNRTLYHLRGGTAWLRNLAAPLVSMKGAQLADELFGYDALAAANAQFPLPLGEGQG
ncbi:MAG: FAD-dependent monooxygenase [Nevskia sp.]|nr:FAD-dependent monooxygenase [Nevskia sp.]